ncbi:SDR family oxidoreductase [Paenibacillus sp. N1-5-1-14]|uniref:SDR family oxidoreductase n=1 Tax=Paenibacillus radicibacter TaxID=2972488 RepID=UPI002158ED59|nr:SDR family oxidoreductase [Paenibacillus radicibacter]MCR8641024.1 SDR family oxidoreductase [Paenibacillus radicibacter]
MEKIICITGASSGVGLATALKFANEGWIVYAGTRNVERDQKKYASVNNLHFVEMEVKDPASLTKVMDLITEQYGRIDLLFCNAGFGFIRTLGQASIEQIQSVFDTNVYGVIHTIRAALPLLRKSESAHIVATSSVGGLVGQPLNEIYCASKFAIEGLLESLATYYKPLFNIDVTLLEPGAIESNFASTALNQLAETGGVLEDEYKPIVDTYIDMFSKRNSVPQTSEAIAELMYELAYMDSKPLRIRTSEAAEQFVSHKVQGDPTGLQGITQTRKIQLAME